MRFKITRASDDIETCDEAFKVVTREKRIEHEIVNCEVENGVMQPFNETDIRLWKSYGKNHVIGYYTMERDVTIEEEWHWEIEINSLEELMELSKKYGELIIDYEEMSILIYDYYIE